MANRTTKRYAKNVHQQINPNATKRNTWTNLTKAVSVNGITTPAGSGSAAFTDTPKTVQKKVKVTKSNPLGLDVVVQHTYNYPYTVAAYQFDLNIPSNAYIFKVTFKVCMKVAKGVNVKVPEAIGNLYGSGYANRLSTGSKTGWINGYYHMQPNEKLSTSWKIVEYTVNESAINQGGVTPDVLNNAMMGIDLHFENCGNADGNIYIKWVHVTVDYDVPNNQIGFNVPTSQDSPYRVKTGDTFRVAAVHTNDTAATDVDLHYPIVLPPFGNEITNNWGVSNEWVVPVERYTQHWLWFTITPHILGLNKLEVGGAKFWFYSTYGKGDDYSTVTITPSILRKGVTGCIQVNAHVFDEDGIVTFNVVYAEGYANPSMKFTLNAQLSSNGVSVRSITSDAISLSIPPRTECDVCFDVCAVPYMTGEFNFKLTDDDGDVYKQKYNVLPPYTYRFCNRADANEETFDMKFLPVDASFTFDRFATQTELGMTELDALFNEETMYVTDCDVTASEFEKLDYVGCVPLHHSHFDPQSDYTDTLLNETYKNKTYMGKKGVIDETITLNLRVPPADVTTLQGLVEMDKPVPINTCHTAFEGDALNHRGWVELYGVKDVEKTNPNYYKIALDVKYLTHNIATKFDIVRHSKITELPIPTLYSEVLSFDDPLSNGLQVVVDDEVVESSDFFDVDTDGTYQFIQNNVTSIDDENDEDISEVYDIYNAGFSNMFNLGEGQHVRVTSHKTLSQNVKISCNWESNQQGTTTQNNSVKRVFRIRDASNKDNVLFEYTYYDFNFEVADFVKAHVTSTYVGTDDNIKTVFNSEIAVRSNVEYDYTEVVEGEAEDDLAILGSYYGSQIVFELNGNHLTVTDCGYNGKELYGSCDLKIGSYIFECEFTNLLTQTYEDDALLYVDMEVYDTYLQSDYADMYNNLVVSPYPVIGKEIVFTRHSEEGTIYYLKDDNEPFKYLLEPYYQYHCGVDLKTSKGISLFNLNNSYSTFYLQNGLVRMGFNRVDGEVSLAKYDPTSGEYVTTHYFKLNANVKFDKGILNDDKIEILADTMTFTMWRGHPYIMINHPNNDIEIKSIFTRVFGETDAGGLPSLISLMNEDNLLPACVGGSDISSKCIETVVNRENTVETHTISCVPITENIVMKKDPDTPDVTFQYLFDGESNPSVASDVRFIVGGIEILGNTHKFSEEGIYDVYAVYLGDDLNQYAVSPIMQVKVVVPIEFPETASDPTAQTTTPGITGKFTLTCDTPDNKHFEWKDNQQIRFTLRRGGTPIAGKVVQVSIPGHTEPLTDTTNAAGQVVVVNNFDVKPKNTAYYVQAAFYDQINDDDDPQILYKKNLPIFIDKQSTIITMTTPETRTKGQYATFQLKLKNKSTVLKGKALQVNINGGSVKVPHTNDNGNINVKLIQKGTFKFKIIYAGTTYRKAFTLNKNVKVN